MEFYIIRHGETDSNKKKLIQGQTNESLNYQGLLQVRRTIPQLRKHNFSIILSSDLNRAKETSKIISENIGLEIKYFKLLREKDNGSFTGKPPKTINWKKISGRYEDRRAPGGESLNEVLIRVKKFVVLLKKGYKQKTILVVSHGTILKLMKGYLEHLDIPSSIEQIKIKNSEVYKLKC